MTKIEWVKNPDNQTQGITVNSKTGCLNHDNGLCKGGGFPCYAYRVAHGRLKVIYQGNWNFPPSFCHQRDTSIHQAIGDTFYPRFWPDRLAGIRKIQKPTGIFLDDMSDWMGEYWPKEWTEMELQVMRDCPQHRFYTLTKQPQQLPQWSPFPENCWVAVTATNHVIFHQALIWLQQVQAVIKFISLEPFLSPIEEFQGFGIGEIHWLTIGACTGTVKEMSHLCDRYPHLTPMQWGKRWTAQPPIECLSQIVEAADKAGVKVFLKNNLNPLIHADALSGQYALDTGLLTWDGQLRQEMPNVSI